MEEKEVEKSHTEVPLLWYANSTLDVRRQSNNFFKILKGVNFLFRIVYSVKVTIECETVIKICPGFKLIIFYSFYSSVEIPWRREWQLTSVFFPGDSHGQTSLLGYGPWSHKESAWLHTQPSWPSLSSLNGLLHICVLLGISVHHHDRMSFACRGCTIYCSKSSSFLMTPFLWNKYFSRFLRKRQEKSFFFKVRDPDPGIKPTSLLSPACSLPLVPPRKLQEYWQ